EGSCDMILLNKHELHSEQMCKQIRNNTEMIKQFCSMIPVNKGMSVVRADVRKNTLYCFFHVFTLMYVRVGRVLPVTHRGSLALHNAAPEQSGKTWGGAGTSKPAWDKAGQDRMEHGRTVKQQKTAQSS
ncbi:hypothetical protein GOODEAATRI_013447, partial [Goodea atripinnis]